MSHEADAFTRDLFTWQAQILADRGLTPICLHVALVIAQHINRATGEAWPAQTSIAEQLQLTARGVRNAVEQLASKGHLMVAVRHGRGDSNRYRIVLRNRNGCSSYQEENRKNGSGLEAEKRNNGSGISLGNRNDGSSYEQRNRNDGSKETGTVVPPNHLIEPSEERLSPSSSTSSASSKLRRARAEPTTSDTEFSEWWLCNLRKTGKAEARRAYDRVIAAGDATHAELVAGMMRYAAERTVAIERNPADARFTKHPATWLNKGCWSDEPLPDVANGQYVQHPSQRFSALDYVSRRFGND